MSHPHTPTCMMHMLLSHCSCSRTQQHLVARDWSWAVLLIVLAWLRGGVRCMHAWHATVSDRWYVRCPAWLQPGPLLRPTPLTTDLHSAWFAKHVQGKTRSNSNSQPPAAQGGADAGVGEQTGADGDGGVAAGHGTGGWVGGWVE